MSENSNPTVDALKSELETLKSQLQNIVKTVEAKNGELTSDMAARFAKEMEHYKKFAGQKVDQLRDAGQAGLDELGDQVRRNPVASLGVAFASGFVLSCLIRHLR